MYKRVVSSIVIISIVALLSLNAKKVYASEDDMKVILKDSLYGGMIGALIGGTCMLFDPDVDNFKFIGYGTGAGILAGAFYGIITVTPLFEYREGTLYIGVPTTKISSFNTGSKKGISVSTELLKLHF